MVCQLHCRLANNMDRWVGFAVTRMQVVITWAVCIVYISSMQNECGIVQLPHKYYFKVYLNLTGQTQQSGQLRNLLFRV